MHYARIAPGGAFPASVAGRYRAAAKTTLTHAQITAAANQSRHVASGLYGQSAARGQDPQRAVGAAATSWAVGTAIVHWNGTAWKPQPPGESFELLTGVAATSASNAWAVGYFCTAKCGLRTSVIVIVHWNGTAWNAVTTLPARSR